MGIRFLSGPRLADDGKRCRQRRTVALEKLIIGVIYVAYGEGVRGRGGSGFTSGLDPGG